MDELSDIIHIPSSFVRESYSRPLPYEEQYPRLKDSSGVLSEKQHQIIRDEILILPNVYISQKTVDQGLLMEKTVKSMSARLDHNINNGSNTTKRINYHMRMMLRSADSLNNISFHHNDVRFISGAVRGLRQDIFWNWWYIEQSIQDNPELFNKWKGVTIMFDNDPGVSGFYTKLKDNYNYCLKQLRTTDHFLEVAFVTSIFSYTTIYLYTKLDLFDRQAESMIKNMKELNVTLPGFKQFDPRPEARLSRLFNAVHPTIRKFPLIPVGIFSIIYMFQSHTKKVGNELEYNSERLIDCLRMINKTYAFVRLVQLEDKEFDKNIDDRITKMIISRQELI